MLPKPSKFTIPSIHDDTELECRLYHPLKSSHGFEQATAKGAIIAHPYAPLGGCMDDPVVQLVGEALLQEGYVLGLFNFRGAGISKSRTSWSGRPEQADYISFVGFFLLYLLGLRGSLSTASSSASPICEPTTAPSSATPIFKDSGPINLILGGYSFGALVTSQLPEIEDLMSNFNHVSKGSAAAEIRLRATRLSKDRSEEGRRLHHRGQTLTVEDALDNTSYGGEECEPGSRRPSRESRRSMDVVRKGVEASKVRLHLKTRNSEDVQNSQETEDSLEALSIPPSRLHYLLISPLLPPAASFLTMFSNKRWQPQGSTSSPSTSWNQGEERFRRNLTLAVYGSNDFFTSSKKLQKWAKNLASVSETKFTYKEVIGAGHFWQEAGAAEELEAAITRWLQVLPRTGPSSQEPAKSSS